MNTKSQILLAQQRRGTQTCFNPLSKRKNAVGRQGWIESLPAARHSEAPESYKELGQFSLRANGRVGSPSLPPPESSLSSCPPSVENSSPASTSAKFESIRLYRRHAPCSMLQARSSTSVPSEQSAVDSLLRSHRRSAQETTTPVYKIDVST